MHRHFASPKSRVKHDPPRRTQRIVGGDPIFLLYISFTYIIYIYISHTTNHLLVGAVYIFAAGDINGCVFEILSLDPNGLTMDKY